MATILVVDDDLAIREMIAAVIESESDHEVVLASHGKDALRQLGDQHVDAIVCDVNMPVMNGLDLVRELRDDPHTARLPVVLISAGAYLDRLDRDVDVDLMLEKPFEISTLLSCIQFALRRVHSSHRHVRVGRHRAAFSIKRALRSARTREHRIWHASTAL
jgi:CheY-like chemotaxis protein